MQYAPPGLRICKVSSCTNTPAPERDPVFICKHLNYLVDVRLQGKLAEFGNFINPVCSYSLNVYRSLSEAVILTDSFYFSSMVGKHADECVEPD